MYYKKVGKYSIGYFTTRKEYMEYRRAFCISKGTIGKPGKAIWIKRNEDIRGGESKLKKICRE